MLYLKSTIFGLLLIFLITSCNTSERENDYFYNLDKEIVSLKGNSKKINNIYLREKKKYNESGKKKFLISSKYIEALILLKKERITQIPLVYSLLNINNDKYEYITITCNYNLALKFEISSPEWALTRINKAIQTSEKSKRKFELAHLYHFKGRILYNINKNNHAIVYFKKALKIYKTQNETLFMSSMHNNIGMCYNKMGNKNAAIKETSNGINLLSKKKKLNNEEVDFLYRMKGNNARYFISEKKYKEAEAALLDRCSFALKNKKYSVLVNSCRDLMIIYNITKPEKSEKEKIINYLNNFEPHLKTLKDKITLAEIKQKYYYDKKDIENYQSISNKLNILNKENDKELKEKMKRSFQVADNSIIKNINNEYAYEKRKMLFITISTSLISIGFIFFTLYLFRKKKIQEELIKKENIISESEKIILEQNLKLKNEKIKNFQLLLDIKTKTEKTFLDNLKKMRKSKEADSDQVLKDLFLKVNNLISIDNQNNDLINESSAENQYFINKLSEKFPSLNKQELNLCVYFKLNLAAKEIALIQNYTVGSVRVYKTKIKKKLGLNQEDDLKIFLQNLN